MKQIYYKLPFNYGNIIIFLTVKSDGFGAALEPVAIWGSPLRVVGAVPLHGVDDAPLAVGRARSAPVLREVLEHAQVLGGLAGRES